jgi:hypothetical protein
LVTKSRTLCGKSTVSVVCAVFLIEAEEFSDRLANDGPGATNATKAITATSAANSTKCLVFILIDV